MPSEIEQGSPALLAINEIGLHRPFTFDVQRSAGLEAERIAECLTGSGRNVDAPGQGIGLHALGGIHGVAPDIECDFVGPEHASDNRPPGVDPDAQSQPPIETPADDLRDLQQNTRGRANGRTSCACR